MTSRPEERIAPGSVPLLRDELAAVETKGQYPGEHLHRNVSIDSPYILNTQRDLYALSSKLRAKSISEPGQMVAPITPKSDGVSSNSNRDPPYVPLFGRRCMCRLPGIHSQRQRLPAHRQKIRVHFFLSPSPSAVVRGLHRIKVQFPANTL
jgi:hypothetical protein